jgi:hypothetical protein
MEQGERKIWLEDAILDYISKHYNRRLIHITEHFKLRVDITMESLGWLVITGAVNKDTSGIFSLYSANK